MNWKEINEQYPLATREYLRSEDIITNDSKTMDCTLEDVDDSTYFFKTDNGESFCIGSDEVLKMPEYFDELGIHVGPDYYKGAYVCPISIGNEFSAFLRDFPTRREALEAGVKEAFRIREEQLKQKEK